MIAGEELEVIAEEALRAAKFDPAEPPDPIRLAKKIIGRVLQLPACGLPCGAFLAQINGQTTVCIRGELRPAQLAWSLCHEVAEALLHRRGYAQHDVETVADELAARLRAPFLFAARACGARGPAWAQLALDFGASESCAVLRYGEVTGRRVALLTKEKTRYRGDWFERPSPDALRKGIKGLVKASLESEPGRLAVWAG